MFGTGMVTLDPKTGAITPVPIHDWWKPLDFVPIPLSEVRESVEDEEPCWYDLYDDRMFCGSEDEPSY